METTTGPEIIALGSFIKFDAAGAPFLQGFRCGHCAELMLETRRACPKCATVGSLQPEKLATHGKLKSYTIVHRSFPGVKTPFISVVVQLDGGVYLKGNLVGVEPKADSIRFDMPIAVQFDHPSVATKPNADVVRYVFVPATHYLT